MKPDSPKSARPAVVNTFHGVAIALFAVSANLLLIVCLWRLVKDSPLALWLLAFACGSGLVCLGFEMAKAMREARIDAILKRGPLEL